MWEGKKGNRCNMVMAETLTNCYGHVCMYKLNAVGQIHTEITLLHI